MAADTVLFSRQPGSLAQELGQACSQHGGQEVWLVGGSGGGARVPLVLLAASCPLLRPLLQEESSVVVASWSGWEVGLVVRLLRGQEVCGRREELEKLLDGLLELGLQEGLLELGLKEVVGKDKSEPSLLSLLTTSSWRACPLCRREQEDMQGMVAHLLHHSEVWRLLEEETPVQEAYSCPSTGAKALSQSPPRGVYSVLFFSPLKGDLPPMGGILVKMPPKCPP